MILLNSISLLGRGKFNRSFDKLHLEIHELKKYFTAENAAAWLACMEKYKPLPYGPRVKSARKFEIWF